MLSRREGEEEVRGKEEEEAAGPEGKEEGMVSEKKKTSACGVPLGGGGLLA